VANRPWFLETLIYEGVKLEKVGEDWFEPVINIHTPLFTTFTQLSYMPSLQISSPQKKVLKEKHIEGRALTPLPLPK
jgi:hypothetical protein